MKHGGNFIFYFIFLLAFVYTGSAIAPASAIEQIPSTKGEVKKEKSEKKTRRKRKRTKRPKPTGGEFTLQSADGSVSLSDFRGKVVLIYFGYTMCPDVCPVSLDIMAEAFGGLNESELKGVQGIFISLDPGRDTTQRLKEYAAYFHPNIIGLVDKKEAIDDVCQRYGCVYKLVDMPNSSIGYGVLHSSRTAVVGRDGKLITIYNHETPAKTLIDAIRGVPGK